MHYKQVINPRAHGARHVLSFVMLRKYRNPSDPSRSLIISPVSQPMSSTASPGILCKKLCIGETGRRLGNRYREHLRDVEKDDKDASEPVALSLHQGSTESDKTLEQKIIYQIGTLNLHGINELFS